jgi:uncharacterized protein (TIGR03382 family)
MRFTALSAVAFGAALIVMSIATPLFAGIPAAPEIDSGTIAAGVGVLVAGAVVLRARRRSK